MRHESDLPSDHVCGVRLMIETAGSMPPDWLNTTQLNIPDTLDLSWPEPAPQPWNNSKNVGQFIWDRINPNPGQWRNGVKLMHHIMTLHRNDPRIVKRAMIALGNMYHNLFDDHLYAGDVCRVAGRLPDAEHYYRKALTAADKDNRNENQAKRDKGRAEASLAAIQFFRLSPQQVKDGTYSASSLGYEGPIDVQVIVKSGVMTDVKVTKHREKQFYSSIEDTPRNILARQAFAQQSSAAELRCFQF